MTTLLNFLFLFFLIFNNFFITPVFKENIKLKLALAIPIDIPPLVADKTLKSQNNFFSKIVFDFIDFF